VKSVVEGLDANRKTDPVDSPGLCTYIDMIPRYDIHLLIALYEV